MEELDLDDLLADAVAHAPARKVRGGKPEELKDASDERLFNLFHRPENWARRRGIALVHKETQTLLGNFSEYVHVKVKGCRKLDRESVPLAVTATEEVSGPWWIGEEYRQHEKRPSWHERRRAIIDLHFEELGVVAACVEVDACLSYGAVARVELVASTQFMSTDRKTVLMLPAELNVLDVMHLDDKLRLRKEINL